MLINSVSTQIKTSLGEEMKSQLRTPTRIQMNKTPRNTSTSVDKKYSLLYKKGEQYVPSGKNRQKGLTKFITPSKSDQKKETSTVPEIKITPEDTKDNSS